MKVFDTVNWMGSEDEENYVEDGESPVRKVRVDGFWMDKCEVTNGQYLEVCVQYRVIPEFIHCLK